MNNLSKEVMERAKANFDEIIAEEKKRINNLSMEGVDAAVGEFMGLYNEMPMPEDVADIISAYLPYHRTGQADNSELLARGIEWLDEGRAPHPYKGLVTYDLIKDLVAALTPPTNQKGE